MQSAIAYHLTTCPQFVTFTGRNADWTDTHIPRTERPVRFHVATSRFVGATHPTRWAYIA